MRALSLSSNTTLLRQALPILVRPILFRTTASPNHISFFRSTSQITTLFRAKHDDRLLFTLSSLRKFTSRATNVNDAGSIDLPLIQSMQIKVLCFIAPYMFDELLASVSSIIFLIVVRVVNVNLVYELIF
jgi:hypothetical protein